MEKCKQADPINKDKTDRERRLLVLAEKSRRFVAANAIPGLLSTWMPGGPFPARSENNFPDDLEPGTWD